MDVIVLFWAFGIDVRFSEHELSLLLVEFSNVFEWAFACSYSIAVLNMSTAVVNFGSASWNSVCCFTYFANT